jgi:membrane dipeptidase
VVAYNRRSAFQVATSKEKTMKRRDFLTVGAGLTLATAAIAADEAKRVNTKPLTDNLNSTIQHAREVALKILQPSPKELEHGLRLHAESIVFDGYGFAPRAAVDGDAIKQAIEEGASDIEISDMRESMSMTRYVENDAEQAEFMAAFRASGVTCIFQNAGQEGQAPLRLIKRLARFTYATDMMRDFLSKAATSADIEAAKEAGRHCLYMTGNGVPLTQDWISIPDELRYLTVFYQLGIRMMHLTYQRRNMIGDGCAEKANAGLSDFGKSVIAEMNRVGVIPDCAHSGWQTSLEAAQVSTKPVVASHTTCAKLHPHIRSKPDNVIKAIADTGGYVGMCCISRFLRGKGDIGAFLDHIEYVKKKFGADHVAIGTDVAYTSANSAEESKKIPRTGRRKRKDFRSLWPADDFRTTPEASVSISWTNWPLFTVGMVQRGFTDDEIRKVIGGNVMRVANETMKKS